MTCMVCTFTDSDPLFVSCLEQLMSTKAAARRKSFCARMSGVKGPTSKDGKPTRKGLALKKWDC